MAEPLGRHLRPARRSGLTSPEPVRIPYGPRGHLTIHLPEGWHREQEWASLFQAATGPPAAAA